MFICITYEFNITEATLDVSYIEWIEKIKTKKKHERLPVVPEVENQEYFA